MNIFAKLVFITSLSLALSGCFVSDDPLIDISDAEQVFPPGAYRAVEYDDGNVEEEWFGTVHYVDGMIRSDVEDFPFEDMMFRRIARRTYAAQSPENGDFMYLILITNRDGSANMYLPMCENLSSRARNRHDLVLDDNETCEVGSWNDLRGAFRDYIDEEEASMMPHISFHPIDEDDLPVPEPVGKPLKN